VLLAGDVGHALCLCLMSKSDLFVRPTYQDGDAISVREAVAAGVPVVASNVGTRPPGVALFRAGNVDELTKTLSAHLEGEARPQVVESHA
jgi:glycosyltransferase involved in cell wall biosynthesis